MSDYLYCPSCKTELCFTETGLGPVEFCPKCGWQSCSIPLHPDKEEEKE